MSLTQPSRRRTPGFPHRLDRLQFQSRCPPAPQLGSISPGNAATRSRAYAGGHSTGTYIKSIVCLPKNFDLAAKLVPVQTLRRVAAAAVSACDAVVHSIVISIVVGIIVGCLEIWLRLRLRLEPSWVSALASLHKDVLLFCARHGVLRDVRAVERHH